jgi:hypothetical protein
MSYLAALVAAKHGIAINTLYLIHTNGACETYAIVQYLPGDTHYRFFKRAIDNVDHTKEDFAHESFTDQRDAHRRLMSAIEEES